MSHYTVTLPGPDYIYDRARQIAEGTSQSIEAVLLQQLQEAFAEPLPALPLKEQRELEALVSLSDDALWTIAREQMPENRQVRLRSLMDANSQGALDDAQQRIGRPGYSGPAAEFTEGPGCRSADRAGISSDSGGDSRSA